MLLLALFACDSASTDTDDTGGAAGCQRGPTIEITSPASSSELPINQPVALEMTVESEVDAEEDLRLLWNVFLDGASDDENIGVHTTESWTPDVAGIWTIRAQVEDSCTDELAMNPVQDSVRVEVVE